MLAYWLLKPRGELRQDYRQLLAQVVVGKDGVRQYLNVLGIDQQTGNDKQQAEFVKNTKGMSTEEKLEYIASSQEPLTSGLSPEQLREWGRVPEEKGWLMAIRVAQYNISVGATARGVSRVFQNVATQASGLGQNIQDALSFGIGNFLDISTLTSEIADIGGTLSGLNQIEPLNELAQVSDRLAAAPEDLQVIQRAATEVGVEFDTVADAITEFSKRAAEARADGGAVADAFQRLNIDPEQFRLLGPLQQFERLQTALNGVNNQADRLFLLDEIAGDVGVQLSGLFQGDSIQNARAFFDEVGGGLDV